jgi:hypothetical protein
MKMPRRVNATRIHALVVSSLSVLAYAQILPGLGNPVIIDSAAQYKGDPLDANVKIDKVLVIRGKPPVGWTPPKFDFQVNVRENLPPAPQGCKWQAPVYTPSTATTNVTSGQAGVVQVKNVLDCEDRWCAAAPAETKIDLTSPTWLAGNTPRPKVTTNVAGWATPTSTPKSTSGPWFGLNANGSGGSGTYTSEIPFCLCPGSTATADVRGLRGDNQAKVVFDTSTLVAQTSDTYNFGPFRDGASGTNGITNGSSLAQNHALKVDVNNNGGETGYSMTGTLLLKKGYLGACKPLD